MYIQFFYVFFFTLIFAYLVFYVTCGRLSHANTHIYTVYTLYIYILVIAVKSV